MSETILSIDAIPDDSLAIPGLGRNKTAGMSPKKAHEVHRMSSFIADLLNADETRAPKPRHVVDIGAGQVSNTYSCEIYF